MSESESSINVLRKACLKRGVHGIAEIGRTFRIYDDNRDRKICMEEFQNGLSAYSVQLSDSEVFELFRSFDRDGSGLITFNEFLEALRPPLAPCRLQLIDRAFDKLDKNGNGVITVEDLNGTYDVTNHPKFKSGVWTRNQVLQEFLDQFQRNDKDGIVTREEFLDYYSGVSASIDKDVYFDLMMRRAWKL